MTSIRLRIYPELSRIPEQERREALDHAKSISFDGVELGGMALGLLVATAATRFALPETFARYVAETLASFVIAVPTLCFFIGPFLVRRTRRGLNAYLLKHHQDRPLAP